MRQNVVTKSYEQGEVKQDKNGAIILRFDLNRDTIDRVTNTRSDDSTRRIGWNKDVEIWKNGHGHIFATSADHQSAGVVAQLNLARCTGEIEFIGITDGKEYSLTWKLGITKPSPELILIVDSISESGLIEINYNADGPYDHVKVVSYICESISDSLIYEVKKKLLKLKKG